MATETGRAPGAVLVVLDVRRCKTETALSEEKTTNTVTNEGGQEEVSASTTYRLRAQAALELSLRMIDLATGRELGERSLARSSEQRDFASNDRYPSEPAPLDLLQDELVDLVEQIRRMFLPWTERINVVFYDDRDCGLRNAYRALRGGDLGRALALSEQNLASCQRASVERKLLARAHYNVGVIHLLRRDYDASVDALYAAEQLRSSAIMREGLAVARKARDLAASMAGLERGTRGRRVRGGSDEVLRNADVVRMVREGVPKPIILSKVAHSSHDFDTSTPAIISLVDQGIDQEIIKALLTAD